MNASKKRKVSYEKFIGRSSVGTFKHLTRSSGSARRSTLSSSVNIGTNLTRPIRAMSVVASPPWSVFSDPIGCWTIHHWCRESSSRDYHDCLSRPQAHHYSAWSCCWKSSSSVQNQRKILHPHRQVEWKLWRVVWMVCERGMLMSGFILTKN